MRFYKHVQSPSSELRGRDQSQATLEDRQFEARQSTRGWLPRQVEHTRGAFVIVTTHDLSAIATETNLVAVLGGRVDVAVVALCLLPFCRIPTSAFVPFGLAVRLSVRHCSGTARLLWLFVRGGPDGPAGRGGDAAPKVNGARK